MVLTTAYLHGPFFQRPDARGGLSGVQDLGVGAIQKGHKIPGLGGNGTHTLHGVEHQPLRF